MSIDGSTLKKMKREQLKEELILRGHAILGNNINLLARLRKSENKMAVGSKRKMVENKNNKLSAINSFPLGVYWKFLTPDVEPAA